MEGLHVSKVVSAELPDRVIGIRRALGPARACIRQTDFDRPFQHVFRARDKDSLHDSLQKLRSVGQQIRSQIPYPTAPAIVPYFFLEQQPQQQLVNIHVLKTALYRERRCASLSFADHLRRRRWHQNALLCRCLPGSALANSLVLLELQRRARMTHFAAH